MDPEEFAIELTRYPVVRSSEWKRSWEEDQATTPFSHEKKMQPEAAGVGPSLADCNEEGMTSQRIFAF